MQQPRLLILETSSKISQVAIARGDTILAKRDINETRRQAQDLVPTMNDLLSGQAMKPTDIDAVIVDIGPGSYTGLRVGIMTAKTIAYATGCVLLTMDTMRTIAEQAPQEAELLDVFIDAQQDRVYPQRFQQVGDNRQPVSEMTICPFAEWLTEKDKPSHVSGPGLRDKQDRIPEGVNVVEMHDWQPRAESLLRLGLPRFLRGEKDDVWAVEPLYLRPSAAEEQWDRLGKK